MNLLFRKKRFNIILSFCLVIFLLFPYVVLAGNSSNIDNQDAIRNIHFYNYMTKSSYCYYVPEHFGMSNYPYNCPDQSTICNASHSDTSFLGAQFSTYMSQVGKSNLSDFDFYCFSLVILYNGNNPPTPVNAQYTFVVPRGSKVVGYICDNTGGTSVDVGDDGKFSSAAQLYFYTDASSAYCITSFENSCVRGASIFNSDALLDVPVIGWGENATAIISGGSRNDVYLHYTNIPLLQGSNLRALTTSYFNGDTSSVWNGDGSYTNEKFGCDSFYFDDFDCSLTRLGDDAQFYASYNYDSCNKIKYSPEDYQLALYFTINAKYKERNSIYNELSASTDWLYYDLHPNHLKSIKIIGSEINFHVPFDGKYYPLLVFDQVVGVINKLRGGNSDDSVEVISCYIYMTAGLVKKGSNAGPSSQNFFYSWDFETLTKRDLTPDLNVITDGDGTDKKVTQIVGNDGGNTVINISVNVQGGDGGDGGSGGDGGDGGSGGDGGDGGSGGDGGDGGSSGGSGNVTAPDAGTEKDTQSKSFWSILKSFVKFLASLIDDNDGLFPVIAAYFTFIPSEFWTCIIAVIVVIAVISIYKLLKK